MVNDDIARTAVLGHRLHDIRRMQRQYISQGQYWLAQSAEIHEQHLLRGGVNGVDSILDFVPHSTLMWPTKKIYRQMTPTVFEPGTTHPGERIREGVIYSGKAYTRRSW